MRPLFVYDTLLLALGGLAAGVVAYLGHLGHPWMWVGSGYFCAAVALVGGLAFAATPPPPGQSARFRVMLGLAVAIGSINVTFAATGGPLSSRYHPWDGLTAATAVLCVVVAVTPGAHALQLLSSLRAAIESILLGIGLAAVCWFYLFAPTGLNAADALGLVVLTTVGGFLMSLSMISFTRGREVGLATASLCSSGLVFASVFSAYGYIVTGEPGWIGPAMSALLWPAIIACLFHTGETRGLSTVAEQARTEWQVMALVGTVMVSLLMLFAGGVLLVAGLGPLTTSLAVGFVLALWLRELVRAWQSHTLLARLAVQARLDGLTQLPNARSLDERLDQLAGTYSGPLSCLTIDLDRFKDVNDLLGRPAGDDLLRVFAGRLAAMAGRFGGEVYRSGGDEFIVLILGPDEVADAVAAQVGRVATTATMDIPGMQRVPVGASVGVAHLLAAGGADPDSPAHPRASVGQSGHAMRQAKAHRTGVALFDQPLASSQRRNRRIEELLRAQLSAGRGVEVHFQPVMTLSSRRLVGVEALARWSVEGVGHVSAAEFIAIAEDSGLMEDLGEQILRTALSGAVATGLIGGGHFVAVNVSALQLRSRGFATLVADTLAQSEVPPRQLVIEVTESVFVRPEDPAVVTLGELAALGVRISLDDFGTGYSSLAYLTRLPVKGLKLDRSITAALDDPKSAAIAVSISEMARRLDLEVVVEGVETMRQERQVRALGLDYVQGLLYAPALPVADLAARLERDVRRGVPASQEGAGQDWDGVPA